MKSVNSSSSIKTKIEERYLEEGTHYKYNDDSEDMYFEEEDDSASYDYDFSEYDEEYLGGVIAGNGGGGGGRKMKGNHLERQRRGRRS